VERFKADAAHEADEARPFADEDEGYSRRRAREGLSVVGPRARGLGLSA
jgi:hypothetical protein